MTERQNPIVEKYVGPIRPPNYEHRDLLRRVAAVLATAERPLSPQHIADRIVRADGGMNMGSRLADRVQMILLRTEGLAELTFGGWVARGRRPVPEQPQQPQRTQQQAEAAPTRLLRPDEPGYPEQQSRIAQEEWRRRDYMAPPRKGEPA